MTPGLARRRYSKARGNCQRQYRHERGSFHPITSADRVRTRHLRRLGIGETRVSADLGQETSRRAKAGPAICRAARGGSYTTPKKSGCFGPTVTTTGGSTRPRASQLARFQVPTPVVAGDPNLALARVSRVPVSVTASLSRDVPPDRSCGTPLRPLGVEVPKCRECCSSGFVLRDADAVALSFRRSPRVADQLASGSAELSSSARRDRQQRSGPVRQGHRRARCSAAQPRESKRDRGDR